MTKEDNFKMTRLALAAIRLPEKDSPFSPGNFALSIFLIFSFAILSCEFPSDPQLRRVSIVLNAPVLGNDAFSPATVHVPLAGQVIWTNDDNVPHSIVGDATEGPCAFESKPLTADKRFSQAFFERIECQYYCGLHGRSMRGRIVVE